MKEFIFTALVFAGFVGLAVWAAVAQNKMSCDKFENYSVKNLPARCLELYQAKK